jgi:hypothetical protein
MVSRRRRRLDRHFQVARKSADTRLKRLPNVIGTGYGTKERDAEKTSESSFIVFVRKKLPKRKLQGHETIPSKLVRNGKEVITDVIEIRGLEEQLRFGLQDGIKAGTLGCFGWRRQNLFGVTCAHCIGGPDNDTSTPDDIVIEYPGADDFRLLGKSADAADSPGTGIYPSYGALDSGLIAVADAVVHRYAAGQPRLNPLIFDSGVTPHEIENSLVGLHVSGWGAASGSHSAVIAAVFVNVLGQFFDLMISTADNGPLTEKGDSGLLWIDNSHRGVGFHMQGNVTPNGGPSTYGFAVFAFRVADWFRLTLIEA